MTRALATWVRDGWQHPHQDGATQAPGPQRSRLRPHFDEARWVGTFSERCFSIGTVDAIVDKLVERRERFGISHISVFEADAHAFAPVVARLAAT